MTTIVKGGGLQVAAAFIVEAMKDPVTQPWLYLINQTLCGELAKFGIETESKRFEIFSDSPSKNMAARRRIRALEAEYSPDLVFTLFGPAYVRFESRHLCGVAVPWLTHSDRLAFRNLGSPFAAAKKIASLIWRGIWARAADYWWVEAPIAKDGLVSRLRCPRERISVIPNAAGPQYAKMRGVVKKRTEGDLKILCLSAYYPHKNLELIPDVALAMKEMRPELQFTFTVTLPQEMPEVQAIMRRADSLGVAGHVKNLGRVPASETPGLYERSDLSFLPSVLEVFSAVYAESQCTGVPLVTADRKFAHDACKDAALYFEPLDARDAAEKIIYLAEHHDEWQRLSDRGREISARMPDSSERFQLLKKTILSVAAD